MRKRAIILVLTLLVVALLLTSCGTNKKYGCVSSKVLVYDSELTGPQKTDSQLEIEDRNLRNESAVTLYHYGNVFHGQIYDGYVFWKEDNVEEFLVTGYEGYTTISKDGKTITLRLCMHDEEWTPITVVMEFE